MTNVDLFKAFEHVATIKTPFDDLFQEARTQIQPAGNRPYNTAAAGEKTEAETLYEPKLY